MFTKLSQIPPLGAINKKTGEYVYPRIANKKDTYICPECNKDLILRQGKIRVSHFSHKVDLDPCTYYSSPNESKIHKDAKMLLRTLLQNKTPISFIRNCESTWCVNKKHIEYEIPEITETSSIILEHRFEYNGVKIADVAYIDNGEIFCIFEICHTHKTLGENRPEPWFEIDAITLINVVNNNKSSSIQIPCMRPEKCEKCIEYEQEMQKRRHEAEIQSEKRRLEAEIQAEIHWEKINQDKQSRIENKEKALNTLYNWLKDGKSINPFDLDNKVISIHKNYKYAEISTSHTFDLTIFSGEYPEYHINLVYGSDQIPYYVHSYSGYKEEKKMKEMIELLDGGMFYIDINWIVRQPTVPTIISYIGCCKKLGDNIHCIHCDNETLLYEKTIHNKSELGHCFHCFKYPYGCAKCKERMYNNIHNIPLCNKCEIENKDVLFFDVLERSDFEIIQSFGAKYDKQYKKWYISKDNTNQDIIRKCWKEFIPYVPSVPSIITNKINKPSMCKELFTAICDK